MDWQVYVYSLLAGAIGANGIPHFIQGILGKAYQTPFGRQSSAVINVLWGWLNLVVASMLLYLGHVHPHLLRSFACVALGALAMSSLLAYNKTKQPKPSQDHNK